MEIGEIKVLLPALGDEGNRAFTEKLVPGSKLPYYGVRLPKLRKLAAEVAREDGEAFLESCDFSSIDLITLYAFVLGRRKGEIGGALRHFDRAVQHLDNWMNCDALCQSFKQARTYPEEVWALLERYCASDRPFTLRAAAVTMLSHFLTDAYVDRVLAAVDAIRCDDYYYRMGAAWCVAEAMAKYRDKTFAYLETSSLDGWTYRKAIRKMIESYRVSDADKAALREMSRARRDGNE